MGSKKKILMSVVILVAVSVLLTGFVLVIYVENIPKISLITPVDKVVTDSMYVSGNIVERSRRNIKVDIPVVINNVYYDIGDKVKYGDVIADIDIESTKSALIDYVSTMSNIPEKYLALANTGDFAGQQLLNFIPDKVIASSSGTITNLNMTSGFTTQLGETLATISDLSKLYGKFSVLEDVVGKFKIGDEVIYSTAANTDKSYIGKIVSISPTATEKLVGLTKQTVVDVFISTDSTPELKAGYSISGTIKKSPDYKALSLPYSAISQDHKNNEFVYIYKNHVAIKRYIVTGKEFESVVEIKEGINKGEKVILNAQQIKNNYSFVRLDDTAQIKPFTTNEE